MEVTEVLEFADKYQILTKRKYIYVLLITLYTKYVEPRKKKLKKKKKKKLPTLCETHLLVWNKNNIKAEEIKHGS